MEKKGQCLSEKKKKGQENGKKMESAGKLLRCKKYHPQSKLDTVKEKKTNRSAISETETRSTNYQRLLYWPRVNRVQGLVHLNLQGDILHLQG